MTKIPSNNNGGLNPANFSKSANQGDQVKKDQALKGEIPDPQKGDDILSKNPKSTLGQSLIKIDPQTKAYANIAASVNFTSKNLKKLQATEGVFDKFCDEFDYPTAINAQRLALKEL